MNKIAVHGACKQVVLAARCCWRCRQPRSAHRRRCRQAVRRHRLALQLSDNDPKKEGLIISIANNLLKAYDPDKIAIEVVTFGPGIDLLRPENPNRRVSKA